VATAVREKEKEAIRQINLQLKLKEDQMANEKPSSETYQSASLRINEVEVRGKCYKIV